jgi:hypothetical protein
MGLLVYHKMGWAKGEGSTTPTLTARMDISLRGRVLTPIVCLFRAWADEVEAKNQGKEWTVTRYVGISSCPSASCSEIPG